MHGPTKPIFALLLLFVVFESVTPRADFARLQKIKPWDITIVENGYNVLVGISEEIIETRGPLMVENLKKIMTHASEELYSVTGGKAYFNQITIVVPNSWATYSIFSNGETVSKANIYVNIGDASNQEPEVQKYVKGTSTTSARAILLPASYVENRASDTNVGKVMLETWFILKYGIIRSYSELTNEIRDTRNCSSPADKNTICKMLRAELDMDKDRSKDSSKPKFEVVRQRSKRVVMIADVSSSMREYNRLNKAKAGLSQYIKGEESSQETSLGIVKFSTFAETLSNLTSSRAGKEALGNIVDGMTPEESTSIGAGLVEALKVLERHPEKTRGAEFILISDGKETSRPYINETAPTVISSNITVHTIAITDDADTRMDALGAATGGLTFIHRDDERGNDIGTAFSDIANYDDSDPAAAGIIIFSARKKNPNPNFTILVDERIGRDTTFQLECPVRNCTMKVDMDSPSQRNFLRYEFSSKAASKNMHDYEIKPNRRAGQLSIKVYEAEAGSWNVRTQYPTGDLGLTVKAFPKDLSNYPILAFSFWGKDQIFADDCANDQTMYTLITRDNNPVTGAEVKATIESEFTFGSYTLFDDGRGRDIAEDDGIYTREFPNEIRNLTKTERFNLKVTVNGTAATIVRTRKLVAASQRGESQSSTVQQLQDEEPVERLQRFVLGGSMLSVAQQPDACKVCTSDIVFVLHPTSQFAFLKSFIYRLLTLLVTDKKARVWMGAITVSETAEVGVQLSRARSFLVPFTVWQPSVPGSQQVNFAAGLRSAEMMMSDRPRRKAIVLFVENQMSDVQETLQEAERLRGKGIIFIPVVVSSTPDPDLVRIMTEIADDTTNVVEMTSYFSVVDQDIRIINLACGFNLKELSKENK